MYRKSSKVLCQQLSPDKCTLVQMHTITLYAHSVSVCFP